MPRVINRITCQNGHSETVSRIHFIPGILYKDSSPFPDTSLRHSFPAGRYAYTIPSRERSYKSNAINPPWFLLEQKTGSSLLRWLSGRAIFPLLLLLLLLRVAAVLGVELDHLAQRIEVLHADFARLLGLSVSTGHI